MYSIDVEPLRMAGECVRQIVEAGFPVPSHFSVRLLDRGLQRGQRAGDIIRILTLFTRQRLSSGDCVRMPDHD